MNVTFIDVFAICLFVATLAPLSWRFGEIIGELISCSMGWDEE